MRTLIKYLKSQKKNNRISLSHNRFLLAILNPSPNNPSILPTMFLRTKKMKSASSNIRNVCWPNIMSKSQKDRSVTYKTSRAEGARDNLRGLWMPTRNLQGLYSTMKTCSRVATWLLLWKFRIANTLLRFRIAQRLSISKHQKRKKRK